MLESRKEDVTHEMILVLGSDGVRELGLVCDLTGVSVHVDWFVSVAQVGWGAVLGGMFTEVGGRGQVIQLVAHQSQSQGATQKW